MTLADIVIAIAALIALIYSQRANTTANAAQRTAEAALQQDVLAKLIFEYRTAEMLVAIRALWDFQRKNPNAIADAYESERKADESRITALPPTAQTDEWRSTLHYRRRLVSQFYALLAGLYHLGILPPQLTFTFWSKGDLEIIPKAIVPIERKLAMVLGTSKDGDSPSLRRMLRLYEDSVSFKDFSST